MDFLSSLEQQLATLHRLLGTDRSTVSIPERLHRLSPDELQSTLDTAASAQQQLKRLEVVASSIATQRANALVHA